MVLGRGEDIFGKSAAGRNSSGAPAPAVDGRSDLLKAIRDGTLSFIHYPMFTFTNQGALKWNGLLSFQIHLLLIHELSSSI